LRIVHISAYHNTNVMLHYGHMNREVHFHEEQDGQILYSRWQRSARPPKAVEWLISMGWAKNNRQATNILLGVAVMALTLSVFIYLRASGAF